VRFRLKAHDCWDGFHKSDTSLLATLQSTWTGRSALLEANSYRIKKVHSLDSEMLNRRLTVLIYASLIFLSWVKSNLTLFQVWDVDALID
jgi:hypothetical protein